MQYYGHFYRSVLYPLLARINAYVVRWIREKYKRLQGSKRAHRKLHGIRERVTVLHGKLSVGAVGGLWRLAVQLPLRSA